MIQEEIDLLLENIKEYKEVESPDEIKKISDSVFQYFIIRKTHGIISNHMEDVPRMLTKLRELPETLTTNIVPQSIGDMDVAQIRNEDIGEDGSIIPSNFDIVKKATPYNGYLPGQVVQWVAPPGVGKSAAMLYEVTTMSIAGYSTLWVALGDLFRS